MSWPVLEIVVIFGGGLLGWMAVSYTMSRLRLSPSAHVDLKADPRTDWPKLLGVSETASSDELRDAYERKVTELVSSAPRLMTTAEHSARRAAQEQLDAAYRWGTRVAGGAGNS